MRPFEHYLSAPEVGERIRGLRRLHLLTQTELALKVGVSKNAVSAWENGLYFPSISHILALGKAFDIDWIYFLSSATEVE